MTIDNNINLTSPLRDSPSLIQNYEMLALQAHQQIHAQLQLNPFKNVAVAYQIIPTDKAIIYQVNYFTDNWDDKLFWKLDIILGEINESPIHHPTHHLKIDTTQLNDTTIKSFEHFNDNNNIENIHRLAGISARQPVDNVDELTKELFLELTEKFVRNFDS